MVAVGLFFLFCLVKVVVRCVYGFGVRGVGYIVSV